MPFPGEGGTGAAHAQGSAGFTSGQRNLREPLLDSRSYGNDYGSGSTEGGGPDGSQDDGGTGHTGSGSGRKQAGQAARVTLNLINSGIGTSTVAMPLVVRTLGVGLAVGGLLLQSLLGIVANHILSSQSERAGADSYADLMRVRFGKWGGRAVALAQMVNSLGKTVVWLIILADLIVGSSGDGSGLLPELLCAFGHEGAASGAHWYLRRWPWILLLAALATPVVCVRSLDKLSGVSLVGDLAVLLIATSGLVLAVVAAQEGKVHTIHWLPSQEEAGVSSKSRLALEVASVFPIMMGAAFTQNNINSVMDQVRPYCQGLLDASQATARLLTIAVFLTIGIANYIVFGDKLQPDVLLNYSGHGLRKLLAGRLALALALAAAVKLSFLINGLVSLPMYLFPYQRNLWAALPQQSAEARMGDPRSFSLTNIASLAGCALVAVLVPSVWKPLKLLGGTAVSCMAFIFPGLLLLHAQWRGSHSASSDTSAGAPERRSAWQRALYPMGWVLVVVGLLQAVASIMSQFI